MDATKGVNKQHRQRRVPVSTRYPEDRIHLLDSVQKRRGDEDRATTIAHALDRLLADYGLLDEAA